VTSAGVAVTGTLSASNGISVANTFGFKNRIINGGMVIDQRNAGASVTPVAGQFVTDRFRFSLSQTSKLTAQQSTTAPAGFINSLLVTSSSAYSVLTGDYFGIAHPIEGLNVADFGWGSAGAATVTLSFWVRSSLTGTFGGAVQNSASNRSYPFSYTISAANTLEQKTITIAGDTTGTWLTTNGVGLVVRFGLGYGSTYGGGTAGAWVGSDTQSVTGAVSVVGTSGATFYITGVQLEKGSTATSFDVRAYSAELAMCQRYYFKTFAQGTAPVQNSGSTAGGLLVSTSATSTFGGSLSLPVTMRAAPATVTTFNPSAANANWRDTNNAADRTIASAGGGDSALFVSGVSGIVNGLNFCHVTATAEL
jgi:hypothetical protein